MAEFITGEGKRVYKETMQRSELKQELDSWNLALGAPVIGTTRVELTKEQKGARIILERLADSFGITLMDIDPSTASLTNIKDSKPKIIYPDS